MESINIIAYSIPELETKVKEVVASDFKPTLALVFSPSSFDLNALSKVLDIDGVTVFGSSSFSEIEKDSFYQGAVVVMFIDMNRDYFTLFSSEVGNEGHSKICEKAVHFAKSAFSNPSALMLTSPISADGEAIVKAVNNGLKNSKMPLFGGMASNIDMSKTSVFTNGKVMESGILLLVFDNDKIELKGKAVSGWDTVGVEKMITKAEGNTVYSIDGLPALDVFLKYYKINEADESIDFFHQLGCYPLQLVESDGTSVLRAPASADRVNRSMMFYGSIPEKTKVKFSVHPSFTVLDNTVNIMEEYSREQQQPDIILLFSCVGRYGVFGDLVEEEITGLYEIWNKPMIGFFTGGEFGSEDHSVPKFHNETCSVVFLREK